MDAVDQEMMSVGGGTLKTPLLYLPSTHLIGWLPTKRLEMTVLVVVTPTNVTLLAPIDETS